MATIAFLLTMFTSPASAALYDVDFALPGGSGFGASLFHDASTGNHMSGDVVGNITPNNPDTTGVYDSITGEFYAEIHDVTPVYDTQPNHFTLSGTLLFDANGVLANDSTLFLDFTDGASGKLVDGMMGFKAGYVCCGSTDSDPNSFIQQGESDIFWLTLWGANYNSENPWDGEYDNKTNLGMDLRLQLTELPGDRGLPQVPVPAAAWLFGSGLLGLVGVARRKNTV